MSSDPQADVGALEEPEENWGDEDAEHAQRPGSSAHSTDSEPPETRTTEVLQKVVLDNRAAIRACYDRAREQNPALPGGDLVLRIVIDPEGAVKSVEQNTEKSTLKSPVLAECALAEVKSWKFPPSSRGMETKLNYPFSFKP